MRHKILQMAEVVRGAKGHADLQRTMTPDQMEFATKMANDQHAFNLLRHAWEDDSRKWWEEAKRLHR